MTEQTIDDILNDIMPTTKTLLCGCRISELDGGVLVEKVGLIAEGFLMRVAEKHSVSLAIEGDMFYFNDKPFAKARGVLISVNNAL